jgi:hypothetical protein
MTKYLTFVNKILIHFLVLLPMTVWAVSDANQLPVRGFAIAAPTPDNFNCFISFIKEDLSKTPVNQLFLRINYNYQFKSHPELAENSSDSIKSRLPGAMHIYWGSFNGFNQCYQGKLCEDEVQANATKTFNSIYP